MSRIELFFLGPPLIRSADSPVELDTRKATALLSYLAVTGSSHPRDSLAVLLWPELGQSQSRALLRQTLYGIRKTIPGDWLAASRDSIGIESEANVQADVLRFRGFIEECTRHDHPASDVCSHCIDHLAKAAKLYRDDFLSGFTVRDSVNFDDWQLQTTEELRRELISVLEKLIRCLSRQGEFEQAIRHARRWLSIDPLYETAHCWLMQLFYWAGLRTAALRQYQECMRVLRQELEAAPAESTTRLFHDIKAGRLRGAPATHALLPEPLQQANDGWRKRYQTPVFTFEEYRLVTVLAVSFQRLEPGGDDAASTTRIITKTLERYGGRVDYMDDDGALVVFGRPRTRESDPELAVRAAMEIHERIEGFGYTARSGINTGGVYFSADEVNDSRDSVIRGSVVNLAVRLRENARNGQILVGESTYRLARNAYSCVPLELRLRGRKELSRAFQVTGWAGQGRDAWGTEGFRTELIGRDEELRSLKKALSAAFAGRGQVAFITGEAGVGKSRLSAELKVSAERDLAAEFEKADTCSPFLWLEGRCLELETATGYWPFVDMFQSYFRIQFGDDREKRRRLIASRLMEAAGSRGISGSRLEEMAAAFDRLLSSGGGEHDTAEWENVHPERVRRWTFLAVRDLFLALCKRKPLILSFEDLHWADHPSLDLISFLMESVSELPLFLLCVFRPERGHRCVHLPTIASKKVPGRSCEIRLKELTAQDSAKLAASLLRGKKISPEVVEMLLERSQGNPFYVEEIVRSAFEGGLLLQRGEPLSSGKEIPAAAGMQSLQSVILSRIDLLQEETKLVLRMASVIGSVFRKRLLRRTAPEWMDLESLLQELEDRELIYEGRVIPEEEYSFRHVLVREIVYETLTKHDRRSIHARIAAGMEALYPELTESLAYHYDQAGNLAKAIHYLYHSGEKARKAYANREAVVYFHRGLELVRRTAESSERDRKELEFVIASGVPLVFIVGNAASEVGRLYEHGYEICKRIGTLDQLYHVQNGLRRFFLARGDIVRSRELGLQMLELADTMNNDVYLARSHVLLAETSLLEGSFSECCSHAQAGLAFCHDRPDRSNVDLFGVDTRGALVSLNGIALTHMGLSDQGTRLADEAVEKAEKIGDPINLVVQSLLALTACFLVGDRERVTVLAGNMLSHSSEGGFELFYDIAETFLGWADVCVGKADRGIEIMEEGLRAAEEMGSKYMQGLILFAYAEALSKCGRPVKAKAVAAQAAATMEASGENWWKAGVLRLLGEIIARTDGDVGMAEECFQKSLETARSQGAKIFEVQAATALCRLWRRTGKARQGYHLLGETFKRFTEGFSLPCMKEAKATLESRAAEDWS